MEIQETQEQKSLPRKECIACLRKLNGELSRATAQKVAAEKELMANLSRTWTGRLVLLVWQLDMTFLDVIATLAFIMFNVWMLIIAIFN